MESRMDPMPLPFGQPVQHSRNAVRQPVVVRGRMERSPQSREQRQDQEHPWKSSAKTGRADSAGNQAGPIPPKNCGEQDQGGPITLGVELVQGGEKPAGA